MALGFGFNKVKVLASAEKYVQQGKLQNAISEYEKVVKEDPKDLTILNTIGDLYARLGQTESAVKCFKRVGDHYAADGFTVKAIAMYKKLTKLAPSASDSVQRLAELYTQQGLYNDAKQQYMLVADQYIKSNNLEAAARIFQKMLELDPENAAMQAKLADLYIRMGKKEDAKEIFFRAAESLYQRAAMDAADEAAAKVLSIEPGSPRALMLRSRIALDSGNPDAAVGYIERISNVDSRPDALNALLSAYLQLAKWDEAEPLARKLLTVHNETAGISAYAQTLLTQGQCEQALKIYNEFAERIMAGNPNALTDELHPLIGRVKESAPALSALRELFRKAGDRTHITEVTELLAHALVQAGDLKRARDLYRELMQVEPENPAHEQAYRQVLSKLGEDASVRPLEASQAAQAFMVDELAMGGPPVAQEYTADVEAAIRSALTDSELLDSYNMPAKALEPVEKILPKAPHDLRLNQRLASLYESLQRFGDAAKCCTVIADLLHAAGHGEQASKYRDMAAKYNERAAAKPAAAPAEPGEVMGEAAFADFAVTVEPPVEAAPAASMEVAPPPSAVPAAAAPHKEIDLSEEWESHTEVETPAAPPAAEFAIEVPTPAAPSAASELADEVRFYFSQNMLDEARAAVDKLAAADPSHPDLAGFRAQLQPAPAAEAAPAGGQVAEYVFDAAAVGGAPLAAAEMPVSEPPAADFSMEVTPPVEMPVEAVAPPPPAPAVAAAAAKPPSMLGDFVSDLEEALPADFGAKPAAPPMAQAAAAAATPVKPPVAPPPPAPVAAPPAAAAAETGGAADMLADIFDEFKEEAEAGTQEDAEDPETHYNLGVAFREMGLLDEAIGELQKVSQAVDRGKPFRDTMQTYTWLAQCFVDKGVPEASIQWYEKALKFAADKETQLAVHYDMASAFEAAGNRQAALQHFMQVYGSNIDYRDVAERIKALRS